MKSSSPQSRRMVQNQRFSRYSRALNGLFMSEHGLNCILRSCRRTVRTLNLLRSLFKSVRTLLGQLSSKDGPGGATTDDDGLGVQGTFFDLFLCAGNSFNPLAIHSDKITPRHLGLLERDCHRSTHMPHFFPVSCSHFKGHRPATDMN